MPAADLDWLLSLAESSDVHYPIRADGVLALGAANRDPKGPNYSRISDAVYKILTTPDDTKHDLGGIVKSDALRVVYVTLPEQRFLSPIKALIDNDNRDFVVPEATKTYISLSRRFNGNDGGVKLVTFGEQLHNTVNKLRKEHGEPVRDENAYTPAMTAEEKAIVPYIKSAIQNRKITDNDLAYLTTHANDAKNAPKLVAEYISPFNYLDPKLLPPTQKEAIFRCLEPLLTKDDSEKDPQGIVKATACLVVSMALPDVRFNETLHSLLSDPREQVKSAAEEAIAAIKNNQ